MNDTQPCTQCGAALMPQSKFCSRCGAKADTPAAAPIPEENTAMPADNTQAVPAYVPQAAPRPTPPPITNAQRWLLPGTLILGILFQCMTGGDAMRSTAGFFSFYSIFWLCYLALFHALCYKQALSRPLGFIPAGSAVVLCILLFFQARAYSDDTLLFLNLLAIPSLLMLHAQYVAYPLPRNREGLYFGLFFAGFLAQPFRYASRFFHSIGSLIRVSKSANRRIWLGIFCAIPIVGVVLWLLLSADAVMNAFAYEWFRYFQLGPLLGRTLVVLMCALLFYGFLYGVKWGEPMLQPNLHERQPWQDTAPSVVIGALLVVYALFTAVQFAYLFGGHGLPPGMTYAQYAHEGFSQLVWVAAINFGLLGLCLNRAQQQKTLRILMLALLAATAVILASAYTRLLLYTGAYGLTFLRILVFWFLCYLTAVLLLYVARVFRPNLPLLRICVVLFIVWYTILNLPNLPLLYAPGA